MKTLKFFSLTFIGLSVLSFFYVSVMAFISPQQVMDLVQVDLTNTDAMSSIRGVYGGVGMTIVISLAYLAFTNRRLALTFLAILWGSYAISRLMTIYVDGTLGAFGTQWLMIETAFCAIGLILLFSTRKLERVNA